MAILKEQPSILCPLISSPTNVTKRRGAINRVLIVLVPSWWRRRRSPGHPDEVPCLLVTSHRVASTMPSPRVPHRLDVPDQSCPLFSPIAEPVGDPTSTVPAPCTDLSFFFAGQDLRRSFSSVARVSESVRSRESIRRDLDHPRSYCSRDRRSLGLFWFEQTSFWRTHHGCESYDLGADDHAGGRHIRWIARWAGTVNEIWLNTLVREFRFA